MFSAPDTVCIRQPIRLIDSVDNASSYYWGFCSGLTFNSPLGYNPGLAFDMPPTAFEIMKEDGKYYGFAAIGGFSAGPDELVVLHFGNSLNNTPDTVRYGTLNNTMPVNTTKFRFLKVEDNWFAFLCGGTTPANSSIARLDLGNSLGNIPNSVNFGNLSGLLSCPRGIFVAQEGSQFYGYAANACDNKLLRFEFGNNISLTPAIVDLGTIFGLDKPSDMAPIYDDTDGWLFFITNQGNSTLTRLHLGNSLNTVPFPVNIGNLNSRLFGPVGISFFRDCDFLHFFIANQTSNDIARVNMADIKGPYTATNYTGVGSINVPTGLSKMIREKDSIFMFVPNWGSNSLSEIIFPQCQNASIPSATTERPPIYSYHTPGYYNIYFAINEGEPNMRTECRQIVVLPIPPIMLSNDTMLCQGDTAHLLVLSPSAMSHTWSPDYNISDTGNVIQVKVWPEFTVDYRVLLPYSNGCIVDTPVHITVHKNKADAGPDRTINDGAKTMLGGPLTTEGPGFVHQWMPDQFIDDVYGTNPVVNPPYDFTYYLTTTNNAGCHNVDTVVVRVVCNDLNMPNAFAPESPNALTRHFGLLNKNIVKLNYFRIFDRWGKEVFVTTDITKQWNGQINEKPAPMGVYVWEADGFCLQGQHFKRSGNVTLIR